MALMNRREQQFRKNLDSLLGSYENGKIDMGEEYFPNLTADEWWEYIIPEIYHMKVVAHGCEVYQDNICRDLRFLGNARMREIILEEVDKEGWLIHE